jgi:hypothetical protein
MHIVVIGNKRDEAMKLLYPILDFYHKHVGITKIASGKTYGTEQAAIGWATRNKVEARIYANEVGFGPVELNRRNARMLEIEGPDLVILVPGGQFSTFAERQALARGINVLKIAIPEDGDSNGL